MNQTAEDRVLELERVLQNILGAFEYTTDGFEVEMKDGGIGVVGDDAEEALAQGTEVYHGFDNEEL